MGLDSKFNEMTFFLCVCFWNGQEELNFDGNGPFKREAGKLIADLANCVGFLFRTGVVRAFSISLMSSPWGGRSFYDYFYVIT